MADASKKPYVFSLTRLLSVMFLLGLIIGPALYEGWLASLCDAYSALFVLGGTCAILLYSFEGSFLRFIPRSFLLAFCKNRVADPEFATIAKAGSRYVIATGAVGSIVGFVAMLQNLADPSGLGKGMAVVVLSLLYSVFLSELVFIPLAKAYSDDDSDSHSDVVPTWRNMGVGGASLTVLLGCFAVLLVCLN